MDLKEQRLAVLGIAEVAGMALVSALVSASRYDSVGALRREVERSVHWPEFCALASSGGVPDDFMSPPALAAVILIWAKQPALSTRS